MRARVGLASMLVFLVPTGLLAVQLGETREAVVAELGNPVGSLEGKGEISLKFDSGQVVTFRDNQVTAFAAVMQQEKSAVDGRFAIHRLKVSKRNAKWIAIVAAGISALIISPIFFSSRAEMFKAIRQDEQGALISALRGEYEDSQWASFKVHIWLALPFVLGFVTYYYLLR